MSSRDDQEFANPKRIPQQSPGLRGTSYPGNVRSIGDNPERVAAGDQGNRTRPQPRWGCESSPNLTQGSSLLATLGFVAQSLWDSTFRGPARTSRKEQS